MEILSVTKLAQKRRKKVLCCRIALAERTARQAALTSVCPDKSRYSFEGHGQREYSPRRLCWQVCRRTIQHCRNAAAGLSRQAPGVQQPKASPKDRNTTIPRHTGLCLSPSIIVRWFSYSRVAISIQFCRHCSPRLRTPQWLRWESAARYADGALKEDARTPDR